MSVPSLARAVCLSLALASGASMLGAVSPADAAEKDELSSARAKFQQALELEQAGNYAHAVQMFREVGQVRMTPQVRYHIASCEEKLGKLVAALGGYELALAEAESLGPDFQKEVEERASSLRSRIPKLVIERGQGAKAATVELDGVSLGSSSIGVEVPIDPGPHTIQAKAPGYQPYSTTVEVTEGELERIPIKLEELTESERPNVDAVAPTPASTEKPVRTTRLIAYGTGGFALAAGAATFVFWYKRNSALDQMRSLCGNDRSCKDNLAELSDAEEDLARKTNDKLVLYDTLFVAGLATTGVALAATATLVALEVFEKKPKKAATLTVQLAPHAPGAELGGISVLGTF
ncbi:MAG: PEGA domain-containing protein [Myxococcales bacterium]